MVLTSVCMPTARMLKAKLIEDKQILYYKGRIK